MKWKKFGVFLLIAFTGCSSVTTTFMSVNSQGNLVENPDRCVHGIPALVKVPTHLEVKIIQTDYWKIEQLGTSPKKLVHLPASTLRNVAITEVMTDKMIMLDPKRPLSGQGEFAITYSSDGRGLLQSINYKAVDTTLTDSAALATAALKAFGVPTSAAQKSSVILGEKKNLLEVPRTIAIQRFPIHQSSQAEIEAFIGQYINMCAPNDCHSPTSYASVK